MPTIKDIKPKITVTKNRGVNTATFGATALTYNEAGHTYNQAGNIYGGDDRISDIGPNFKANAVSDTKPRILEIKNL